MSRYLSHLAEGIWSDFDVLRVLVDCADDKLLNFTRKDGNILSSPEYARQVAFDIQTIFSLINEKIQRMEKDQNEVVKTIVRIEEHGQGN